MNNQVKFILAVALNVAIIFTLILFKLVVIAGGTDVMLHITPVDPHDLLRGDYVTFQYDISNTYNYTNYEAVIRNGDTVYVSLYSGGRYWIVNSVQKSKPANGLFIKGTVASGGEDSLTNPISPYPGYRATGQQRLHIVYGIEQYFIPEGSGRNFNFGNKEIAAKVSIDDNGNSVIKQIYIDGKRWP